MTLDELIEKVNKSTEDDWCTLLLDHNSDATTNAVYIHDISISLAFGSVLLDNYQDAWCKSVTTPGEKVKICMAELLYNGTVVLRSEYVATEYYLLPLPASTVDLVVASGHQKFVELLYDIEKSHLRAPDWSQLLSQAGITVDSRRSWPESI